MKFVSSFGHAWRGIKYCSKTQLNFNIHLWVLLLVIIAGFFFNISYTEWLFIIACSTLVLAFELMNTAMEQLSDFIYHSLSKAFFEFGKKMNGYFTNDALVVATESRTSSPVRIPRDQLTLTHPQLKNLYPCGEGAGYAGGIVSAAMDGESVAKQIALVLN